MAFSLRDVGRRVGMQAPSLYSYFPSKDAIYDAMFAQGTQQLAEAYRQRQISRNTLTAVRELFRFFVEFCTSDPVRYLLLFQRTIPGFEPSPEAFAPSVAVLTDIGAWFDSIGLGGADVLDLFTAVAGGLAAQQVSNDPGGDRWVRMADEAAEMFLNHVRRSRRRKQ